MLFAEELYEVFGVPRTATGAVLVTGFTPILVSTPTLGDRLAWLELYRANAYPMAYYMAATVRDL